MSEQIIDLAPVFEDIRDRIPEDASHLLLLIPSRESVTLWSLPDGMYLGECANKMAIRGANPNKRESRLFLTHHHAVDFVRSLAMEDGDGVLIYEHNIEAGKLIVLPGGESSLAVNGSFRVDGKAPNVMKLN